MMTNSKLQLHIKVSVHSGEMGSGLEIGHGHSCGIKDRQEEGLLQLGERGFVIIITLHNIAKLIDVNVMF